MKSICLRGEIPLACLPACFLSTKKFSAWVYWKGLYCFWPIKLHDLSHIVSLAAPMFWGIFFYHFVVWLQDSSQVNGRRYIFMSSIVCWRLAEVFFFFNPKLNISSFIFLIWVELFWIWFSQKLLFFKVFPICPPVWLDFWILFRSINQ